MIAPPSTASLLLTLEDEKRVSKSIHQVKAGLGKGGPGVSPLDFF